MRIVYIDCEFCKGTGEFLGRICKNCRGQGQIAVKVEDEEGEEKAKMASEKAFIDRLNVNDYRRPFMTEEEVKAFNDERKQHLKNKIKKVDEEIERIKTSLH